MSTKTSIKVQLESFFCQGGNKRPGAFAIYLEPWHADVFDFLDLRKNHGKEEQRARDLFYALWIPDLVRSILLFWFKKLQYHRILLKLFFSNF